MHTYDSQHFSLLIKSCNDKQICPEQLGAYFSNITQQIHISYFEIHSCFPLKQEYMYMYIYM